MTTSEAQDRSPRTRRIGGLLVAIALLPLAIDMFGMPLLDREPAPLLPPAGEVLRGAAPFTFAVVGDSQGTASVYATILDRIKGESPAFLLHCGDLVKECTPKEYRWALHEMAEERLDMPFCSVPGTHDVLRSPDGRGDVSDKRLYERSFGQPHYWFAYGDTLFVAIDTSDRGLCDSELAWLENTLASHRARYKTCIAFTHVPPCNPLPTEGHDLGPGGLRLVAILQKWHVAALFTGHVHCYAEDKMGDLPIYVTGGGGARLERPGDVHHYLVCQVDAGGQLTVQKRDVPDELNHDYPEYYARAKLGREALRAVSVVLLLASVGCVFAARSGGGARFGKDRSHDIRQ